MNLIKTDILYQNRLKNKKLNTSYPLNSKDWEQYLVSENHIFDIDEELSLYMHIPFCTNICSFCEYTKMLCPNEDLQFHYIQTLEKDIQRFINKHPFISLNGFDIGGGTPTSLTEKNFAYLMDIYKYSIKSVNLSSDFEPSIEATFNTLSETKLKLIFEAGIKRISIGIQSTQNEILKANNRNINSTKEITEWIRIAKQIGIEKINLDFMYGLKGQTIKEIEFDIEIIQLLNVEQITVYELRTNMLKYDISMRKENLFQAYSYIYKHLTKLGYYAKFGQNTFSLNHKDLGVSSYLRNRMLNAGAYKGFGISAQSMNKYGISYNIGKNEVNLLNYIKQQTYEAVKFYNLPKNELLSKYIAISAYYGEFSLTKASDIIGEDCYSIFKTQIDYCINNQLLTTRHQLKIRNMEPQ